MPTCEPVAADAVPFLVQAINIAVNLVRAGAEQRLLQDIADGDGLEGLVQHLRRDGETGVGFNALSRQCDDGNLGVPSVDKPLAQEPSVVARATLTTRLGDPHGGAVRVGLPAQELADELADDDDGRVAGIVVDVLEAHLDAIVGGLLQQPHVVARHAQHRREQTHVDGRELGHEDLVALALHVPLAQKLGDPDAKLRIQLAAGQIVGLCILRFIYQFEPLASIPAPPLARQLGPVIDIQLFGPILPRTT